MDISDVKAAVKEAADEAVGERIAQLEAKVSELEASVGELETEVEAVRATVTDHTEDVGAVKKALDAVDAATESRILDEVDGNLVPALDHHPLPRDAFGRRVGRS
jgi:outer membrane murein-binding lipoprotein Lpp